MYNAVKTREMLMQRLEEYKSFVPDIITKQQDTMSAIESLQTFDAGATNTNTGVINEKTKLLIAFGIIAYLRCEECLSLHLQKALELNLTKQEILESCSVAIAFHGGPAMGWTATHIIPGLDQFGIK